MFGLYKKSATTENGWGFLANSNGRQRILENSRHRRQILANSGSSGFQETLAAMKNELQKKVRTRRRSLNSKNGL
jgi:hypothetical protein